MQAGFDKRRNNDMGRRYFKGGTLEAPLPAVMATVGDMENSNIITIGWTGILSSDPPRTYISVRPSRHSHAMLSESGEFVINLTTRSLARATDYAGIYTGAKVDKFRQLGLTKVTSEHVKCPTIGEAPISLECRVFEVIHSGTHDIFMADILGVSCDDSLLDENGRICFDKAELIAYSHGEYFALGEKLGRFGFSTDKPKKKKAEPAKRAVSSGNKAAARKRPDNARPRKNKQYGEGKKK